MVITLMVPLLVTAAGDKPLAARGAELYRQCIRCHGEAGDETGYPKVLTLPGIGDRLTDAEIAARSGAFVSRQFEGDDAAALVLHLKSLKGRGGYDRPGRLIGTEWLVEEFGLHNRYRILDVRPAADYARGHIPNSVHVDPEKVEGADALARTLSTAGIDDKVFTIVVDAAGGPDAAWMWWRLRQAGRTRAAVLDGGFAKWVAEGAPTEVRVPAFAPAKAVEAKAPTKPAGAVEVSADGFDWSKAMTGDRPHQLRPAAELRKLLPQATGKPVRVTGADARRRAAMVFLFELLGTPADM